MFVLLATESTSPAATVGTESTSLAVVSTLGPGTAKASTSATPKEATSPAPKASTRPSSLLD